jgi:Fe-S-cluster-containing hydrogenase component 2
MQCKDALCVKAAKDGAAYTRPDGIVILDPVKANGQKQIVDSCPYGVIYWNEEKGLPEGRGLAQKCTFCAHLLDKGKQPRCVESCPTDAIIFGDMDNPESKVSKLIKSRATETMKPELGIDTAVRYMSLPKPMIGGSVIFGDTGESGADVNVTASDDTGQKTIGKTNNYGDFLIERLSVGKKYTVRLDHPKYFPKEIIVKMDGDASLGEIVLQKNSR